MIFPFSIIFSVPALLILPLYFSNCRFSFAYLLKRRWETASVVASWPREQETVITEQLDLKQTEYNENLNNMTFVHVAARLLVLTEATEMNE